MANIKAKIPVPNDCRMIRFNEIIFRIKKLTKYANFVTLIFFLGMKIDAYHCGMREKGSMCLCAIFKPEFSIYVVFNTELNGSRSIMVRQKHKILMVPFNSALKTA